MQDIKHITEKKRRSIKALIPWKRKSTHNSFRRLSPEPVNYRKKMKIILPLLACILAAYPLFHLIGASKSTLQRAVAKVSVPTAAAPQAASLDFIQSLKLAQESLQYATGDGLNMKATRPDGIVVSYAINSELQERVTRIMNEYKVPYGVFVAVEPKTGKILAIASHSSIDPTWEANAPFNNYPMASLFKLVTAASALELNKVNPDTVMPFRGKLTSESPKYWELGHKKGNQEMDLTTAMGKSVNPVFGRLAGDVVGKEGVLAAMNRFGFDQSLFPGTPIIPCSGTNPQDSNALKLLGAGLCKEVKISPLYAALMMGAIANRGTLLQPQLATEIRDKAGKQLYMYETKPVRNLVSPETAVQLSRMMSKTVSEGTSRKVFRDRRGRPKLAAVDIAAKTGSINGYDPPGHYSWFAAYAPVNDPQIALAALVVNGAKWKIKASLLGEQALEAFFR